MKKFIIVSVSLFIMLSSCSNNPRVSYDVKTKDGVIGTTTQESSRFPYDSIVGKQVFIYEMGPTIGIINKSTKKVVYLLGKSGGYKPLLIKINQGVLQLMVPKIVNYGDTIRITTYRDGRIEYCPNPFKGKLLVLKKP